MSPFQKKQKDKRRKSFFRKWHRRVGFTAALFLLNLAITGILLNHSEDLELHKNYISSKGLISWYGIKAPENTQCLNTHNKGQTLCQLGNNIYLGNQLLIEDTLSLIGFVELENLLYLATSNQLFIYTKQFELVEILNSENDLPTPIQQIVHFDSVNNDTKVASIIIKNDKNYLKLNLDNMSWKTTNTISVMPVRFFNIEETALLNLQNQYLEKQITLLKLVQDFHSGRILLLPGKLLTDLMGIIIILLIVSGFIAWKRRKM